jgi:hypothetical protein
MECPPFVPVGGLFHFAYIASCAHSVSYGGAATYPDLGYKSEVTSSQPK